MRLFSNVDGRGALSSLQTPQRDVTRERKQTRGKIHTWYIEYKAEVLLHRLASALSSSPRHESLLSTGGRFPQETRNPLSSALVTSLNHHAINLSCSTFGKGVLHQTPCSCSSWFGGSNSPLWAEHPQTPQGMLEPWELSITALRGWQKMGLFPPRPLPAGAASLSQLSLLGQTRQTELDMWL